MCPVRHTVFAGEEKGILDRLCVSIPRLSSEAAAGNLHFHGGCTSASEEADGPDVLLGVRGTCEQGDCTHPCVVQDCGTVRDVRNRFFNFGSVSVRFLKTTRIRFGMNLVRFGLQKLGSVRIIIYY